MTPTAARWSRRYRSAATPTISFSTPSESACTSFAGKAGWMSFARTAPTSTRRQGRSRPRCTRAPACSCRSRRGCMSPRRRSTTRPRGSSSTGCDEQPLAADARDTLGFAARLRALATRTPLVALFSLPDQAVGASGLQRAQQPVLIHPALVMHRATGQAVGAREFDASVRSAQDFQCLLVVVEQVYDLEAGAGAANLLGGRIGLLLVQGGPLPVLVARWCVAGKEDAPGRVLPVAFDGLAGCGLRVGGTSQRRGKQGG